MFKTKEELNKVEIDYNLEGIKPDNEVYVEMDALIGTRAFDTFKRMVQYYSDGQRLAAMQQLSSGNDKVAKAYIDKANGASEFLYLMEKNVPKKVKKILDNKSDK